MNANELCAAVEERLGESPPSLFACSPAPREGVRVVTSLLYPDGGIIAVYVLEQDGSYTITDFGDALGWLDLQSAGRRSPPGLQELTQDICETLRVELSNEKLILKGAREENLGESVLRAAQAVSRGSDLWFAFHGQPPEEEE